MVNRKKRLRKGIESIEKQIKLHEEKKERAHEKDKIELEEYYKWEIKTLENEREKKKKFLKMK